MKKLMLVFLVMVVLFSTACGKTQTESESQTIRIAEQYGIAYAPVQIMKEKGYLEANYPGIEISWEQLSNTAAIREAMVADRLDVGFMAIPPFLIGSENGMEWKIATGLSSVPTGLVAGDQIQSLNDFSESDRIAVPQPGSVQHILLAMACDREFSDPTKLDNNLVTLSHPDGMSALLSGGDITAHFTATPYLQKELAETGFHEIISGQEAFGGQFSFIVGVTTNKLHDENPDLYHAFVKSVREAIDFINNNPEEAAVILADVYELSEEEVLSYLTAENTDYSQTVKGIQTFSDFMVKTGYLKTGISSPEALTWENVTYEN
ncbi:ABC transporter substrate-binding protein [Eubacteriaceae bacterium ES2]|nr:ABC transporter substrate-binding protein [Eubacteriaceae bacterium ES2]